MVPPHVGQPRDAEVADVGRRQAGGWQQNVGRLDVAVQHATGIHDRRCAQVRGSAWRPPNNDRGSGRESLPPRARCRRTGASGPGSASCGRHRAPRCRSRCRFRLRGREDHIEGGRQEYVALIAADPKRAARRLSAGLWPPVPARGVYHDPSADGGFTDPFWKTRRDRAFHSSCSPARLEEAERARREREELAAEGMPVPSDRLPESDDDLARWP
jgi:hypothetical protein